MSKGFAYSFTDAGGTRTLGPVTLERRADRDTADLPVVTNNFLADGGDGFPASRDGTGKFFGGLDIDALRQLPRGQLAVHPGPADPDHEELTHRH